MLLVAYVPQGIDFGTTVTNLKAEVVGVVSKSGLRICGY